MLHQAGQRQILPMTRESVILNVCGGLECRSECLPDMPEALGSISSKKKKREKGEREEKEKRESERAEQY